ncbi:hypothetical protein [Streptomyces sp. Isolate_219]|uniref:hypothetical protein n=1 Tax=Streptomyces sp. Isolate_219 TaxID=2950110 RepID=UPI0021C5B694|nr:hypothetical protein [Streptomyces sp. Isolate_219]MCR8573059.1 hypothetical protein [Streptomyces sp. Isolate_219]
MTHVAANHDHLAILAQQRDELDAERGRIEKAHCLAVLDHISAKIRALCPDAVHITFAYYGKTRTLDLDGVLGAQSSPLGVCPWLWEVSDKKHPLAEITEAIALDVQSALAPYNSPAWATVRRNSASPERGNSWLLELPPPDRAARIAQLVREHHPEATAIIVDGRSAGGRVIEIVEGAAEDGTKHLTTRRHWTRECDEILTRLVAQLFAIPTLAGRHLTPLHDYRHPYGTSSDLVRLITLPPTA